ncbi:hypothetical protein [Gorillibacterium sp. CAU 1737]|uniref:hypothetical protein n=1 Tax=Gorillibacterium sp. CAU 1737 TaxID=3140362 RepID=UPI003260F154
MKDLRKYLIGAMAGAVLATAVSAGAASIVPIGKKIDSTYKVTVDGSPLPNQAIVVEGKSYIPTTDVGTATGMKVQFINKSEGIRMTSQEPVAPSVEPGQSSSVPVNPVMVLQVNITKTKNLIMATQALLAELTDPTEKARVQKDLDEQKAKLADLEAQLAALQASPSPSPTPAP